MSTKKCTTCRATRDITEFWSEANNRERLSCQKCIDNRTESREQTEARQAKRRAEIAEKRAHEKRLRDARAERERDHSKPTITKLNAIMPAFGNRSINHAMVNTWR